MRQIGLLKKQGITPKRIITDKLRSYGAAKRQIIPDVEHRSHKGLNNRAENSHRQRRLNLKGTLELGSDRLYVAFGNVISRQTAIASVRSVL